MAEGCVDDGVKEGEGLRLAGEKGGLSPAPGSPAPDLAVPVSGCAEVSLFTDRANQLLVAAIACLTAWRPLSSTLFPDVVAPGRSLAGVSGRSLPVFWSLPDGALPEGALPDGRLTGDPPSDDPLPDDPLPDGKLSDRALTDDGLSADARFDGAAARGAVSVSTAGLPGPLGLPIMSAGNGTGA